MLRLITLLLGWAAAWPVAAAELQFDFSRFKLNETPPDFRSTVGGQGKPGDWKIIMDEIPPAVSPPTQSALTISHRPVLAQLDRDPTDEHFPILLYDKETFGDFTFTTRFKTVGGAVEQMAGVVFRYQDASNYYYLRASSLGHTLRFYKIVNGERSAPVGQDVQIPKGVWHELSVACKGNSIRCLMDGKEFLPPFMDDSFLAGKIGFWTKSDSISYFAEAKISYTPRVTLAESLVRDALQRYPRLLGLKIFAAKGSDPTIQIVASSDAQDSGQTGRTIEQDVMARSTVYYGKQGDRVLVTLPLHDRNGDTVAAVRVVMKSFLGQTEQNAIARALPIVKQMEARVRSARDLVE